MIVNEDTDVIGRLHPQKNNRGLNIYNPYFDEASINACYLLFHNPDPAILFAGVRALGLTGALVAGSFEGDPRVPDLVDEMDTAADLVGRVGFISQRDGVVRGGYQGGYGLFHSLSEVGGVENRDLVIFGAGTVVKGLLGACREQGATPKSVTLYNRTVATAEALAESFSEVIDARPLSEMSAHAAGDVFINATPNGSPWNLAEEYHFTDEMLSRFVAVADVTFVPLEPKLIAAAKRLGIDSSPGHRMFLFQARHVLKRILGVDMLEPVFSRLMLEDFARNWS